MTAPITLTIELSDQQIEALAVHVAAAADRSRQETQPEPWLNVDQAAAYLSCGKQRVYNLISQRRLRHVKDGSRVLVRREWIDEHLKAQS